MARQAMGTGTRRKTPPFTGKMHVRRGDRVRVIRGNYAGQEGTVLKVLVDRNRVIVEGVNERTRHVRPSQENPEGGRIKSFEPIHASNVMLIDPSSGEPSRSRTRIGKDGAKERIATRSGNPIPKTNK